MKMKSKDIAVCAVAVALMFCLAWLPVAAFLIPVLFVACLYRPKHGLAVGLFAGLVCLTFALLAVAGNSNPAQIAVICVVWVIPRALCGLFASFAFWASKSAIKGRGRISKLAPYAIAAAVGVLTNTVLMISCLAVLFPEIVIMGITVGSGWWILMLIGFAELTVAALIMPPLCLTVGKALKLGEFAPKPVDATEIETKIESDGYGKG